MTSITSLQRFFPGIPSNQFHNKRIGEDVEKAFELGNERLWYYGLTEQYFIGSLPDESDPDRLKKLLLLEQLYLSYNLIQECLDRHAAALVGKPFSFDILDGEGNEVEDDGPKSILKSWITWINQFSNSQNAAWGSPWQDAVRNALIDGRGLLRVWTPKRFELATELKKRIALHSPLEGNVEMDLDDDHLLDSITYMGDNRSELHFHYLFSEEQIPEDAFIVNASELLDSLNLAGDFQRLADAEVQAALSEAEQSNDPFQELAPEAGMFTSQSMFLMSNLEPGTLVVRFSESGKNAEDYAEYMVFPNLKGQWFIHEIAFPSVITESIKRCQASCNLALSILNINVDKSGNRIRYLLNALRPGNFVDDPNNPGSQRFEPSSEGLNVSPFHANFVSGIPVGERNNPNLTTPSLIFEDPINAELFSTTINLFRDIMYDMFGQGFVRANGDGSSSGVARVQIKSDFYISLIKQREVVESAFSGMLTTVLHLLDEPGQYENHTVRVSLNIWLGAILPEEANSIIEQYEKRLLSRETAMSKLGVTNDPDAEIQLLDADPEHIFKRAKELAESSSISGETLRILSGIFDQASAALEAKKLEAEAEASMEMVANRIEGSSSGNGGTFDRDDEQDDDDDENDEA